MIRALPILYVTDMDASIRFFAALGLTVEHRDRTGKWTELVGEDSRLALHWAEGPLPEPVPRVQLNFESLRPLEEVVEAATDAGFAPLEEIVDQAWGRSISLRDPDGLVFEIHEHQRELYT